MMIGFRAPPGLYGSIINHTLGSVSTRSLVTKAPVKRARRASPATAKPPALRRNSKRIHEAIARTSIHSAVLTLAKSKPSYVLGLDINTNSTGYAVLGADGRVATWGHVSTTHMPSSDILGIAHAISEELPRILTASVEEEHAQVEWRVGIEDFMRMYRFGQFHNKGIFQLAQLNGIVSYACWQHFNCRPVHTHPSAARGLFGIVAGSKASTGKKSESTVKDQVMEFVLQEERDSHASHELKKLHVNRYGQWTDAAFDIADAYVVAAYTRWMALQELLLEDLILLQEFSNAYMALVLPAEEILGEPAGNKRTKKKAPTVEEKALLGMTPAAKQKYMKELFALGIVDWVKTFHRPNAVDVEELQ